MEVWGGNAAVDNGVVMQGLDAWVYSRPYQGQEAGGDIHYVSSCATGRITRILVADVSGHGRQVASIAAALRILMRRYVNYIEQKRLMWGLNVEFSSLSDSGRFATAVVASYFSPTDRLIISNAGHPRPFRFRGRERTWEVLHHRAAASEGGLANIPLGIAEPTRYDEMSIRLGRDDLILLYTDSVVEAAGPSGRQLGEAGLLDLVRTLDASNPAQLIPSLIAAIEAFAGGAPQDDLTLLLLRRNDLKPRVSLAMGLKAAATTTAAFFKSLLPGAGPFPRPQLSLDNILGAFIKRLNGS
jgi:serine phosphatase RsbU (regulator of sigma subunit)